MNLEVSQPTKLRSGELKYIIEKLFGLDFYAYISGQISLDGHEKQVLDSVVRQYSLGKPLGYILKKSSFFGLDLDLDESVLIPRQETELLVESVIKYIKVSSPLCILDIGTGSGNISVALALQFKSLKIFALDISQAALRVARINVSKYKCSDVLLIGGDLLTCFKKKSFDIIVSNPPYVESSYIQSDAYLESEPRVALDGGRDGLDLIKRILDNGQDYLKAGGLLFLEIGYGQAEEAVEYAENRGWKLKEIVHDYSGIERVIILK